MQAIGKALLAPCLVVIIGVSNCLAQMYTITDLGTLGGAGSMATAINNLGQVAGLSGLSGDKVEHAFRTARRAAIKPGTDDLGFGIDASAFGINDTGQVTGAFAVAGGAYHAYRTAPNAAISPAKDDLGSLGGQQHYTWAYAINKSGQVVGYSRTGYGTHAFRTAPNAVINSASDLSTLGGLYHESYALGINDSGQAVGYSYVTEDPHCFRTAPNAAINPATDDLGTLGGTYCQAVAINASGQVVGYSSTSKSYHWHAFRTAPNSRINPATDDLGTLGGLESLASAVNDYGEVVGSYKTNKHEMHAFLYSGGAMHVVNDLIPAGSGWDLPFAKAINNAGQIAGFGYRNNNHNDSLHAFLLTPIYKASVQPPINADGNSVFKTTSGVVPVRFTLTEKDIPTCTLLPATISVTRTSGAALGPLDESSHRTTESHGLDFRIDNCQYIYSVGASSLGAGNYRVDISINGIFVGHAVFALQ